MGRFSPLFILVLTLLQGGCGTIVSRNVDPYQDRGSQEGDLVYPRTRIYGGVAADIHWIRYEYRSKTTSNIPLPLDIPLSFAADTVLLPLTVYEQFFIGALPVAAEKGDLTAVKLMLEKGENVESRDSWGHSALMSAAWAGHDEIVQVLLENGGAINGKTRQGLTPLFYAVLNGHTATARRLLDQGADPNSLWSGETTPLMVAAGKGNKELVDALIAKGADVNARGMFQFTPLIHAAMEGHTETVQVLLTNGAIVNAKDNAGGTALIHAACEGREETVVLLLQNGADVNAKRFTKPAHPSNSALGCAIHNKHAAIAERLKQEGATL
ncbi:ankyrin repeat domain-containing protein [Nitrospira japonica]|nr:ankyrin repeat domain-containing protein [Nitrospira japonica]